jgi:hypothetical protein
MTLGTMLDKLSTHRPKLLQCPTIQVKALQKPKNHPEDDLGTMLINIFDYTV